MAPCQLRCFLQNKYKQSGKKSLLSSLYAQLPQTAETQLAAKVAALQSEVTVTKRSRSFSQPAHFII